MKESLRLSLDLLAKSLPAGSWASYSSPVRSSTTTRCDDCGTPEKDDSLLQRYSPISPIRVFRPNPNLEIAFDVRTRNPVYVMERLVVDPTTTMGQLPIGDGNSTSETNEVAQSSYRGKRPKRPHFYEEPSLPEAFRSRNASYHRSGYDRGHLGAAANYTSTALPYEWLKDTYNLCNVSPQHPRFNATAWARLEDWVRRVARHFRYANDGGGGSAETWVVTGPLWLPDRIVPADGDVPSGKLLEYRYPALGPPPNVVAVPTHFFKVVAVVRKGRAVVHHACFVVANRQPDDGWRLEDGLVRWADLESAAGLEFFPALVDGEWKQLADEATAVPPPSRSRSPLRLLPTPSSDVDAGGSALVPSPRGRRGPRRPSSSSSRLSPRHLCPDGTCPVYPYPRPPSRDLPS